MRALLYLSTAALLAAPALAQSQTESDLVVTATRIATPINDLPTRVSIIDRDAIEQQNLVTLVDALGGTAVRAGGVGAQTSLFLRGANSNHTIVLLDGVRLNDESAPNGAYDFGLDTLGGVERIEIVRGPLSAIYGSEAIGGVVNILPRRGGDGPFSPFTELSYGSFDTTRALLGAAGAVGALDYGVSAERYDSEGYDQVPTRFVTRTGDEDGAEINSLTASARLALSDAFALDALVRLRDGVTEYDDFSGGAFGFSRADNPNLEAETRQDVWRLGAEAMLNDGLTLRIAAGGVGQDSEEANAGTRTSDTRFTRDFLEANARISEDDLVGIFQNASLILGASAMKEEADVIGAFVDPFSADEDSNAFFASAQADLAFVTTTFSLRRDDYESFGDHATYQVGASVDLGAGRVYGSFGTAFKAPSLYQRFASSSFLIPNPELEPEESETWEIGADWTLLRAQTRPVLQIGASYYETEIENLIDFGFAGFSSQYQNIEAAEIDGFEAYVALAPTEWSSLRLSYEGVDAIDASTPTRQRLARRPEQAWRLLIEARPTARLRLALDWAWIGDQVDVVYDNAGDFVSASGVNDGRAVGAVSANFALTDKVELFARLDNASDEDYELPNAYRGAPRALMAGVRFAANP